MKHNQTAIDFLLNELDIAKLIAREKLTMAAEVVRQAKKMEKEQIEDAHIEGQRLFDAYQHTQWTNDQAENYYKENYEN